MSTIQRSLAFAGLRPGRTLITTTAWPAGPVDARDLPKIRGRLVRFYRGPIALPDRLTSDRDHLTEALQHGRLYWVDPTFTDLATSAAPSLPATTLHRGRWGEIVDRLPVADLPPVPLFFRQTWTRRSECFLVDPDENLTPVTPEECEGYEREAAWAAEHVEMRLNDLYAGRPSKVVAASRVRR